MFNSPVGQCVYVCLYGNFSFNMNIYMLSSTFSCFNGFLGIASLNYWLVFNISSY